MDSILLILLGLVAGVMSGLIGIGGGVIIVPALVFLFKLSQHQAQGTTLALMIPPIGILAVWSYYKQGAVDFRIAALVALGFLIGGLVGAKLVAGISDILLEKIFGVVMLLIALKMIFAR
ncbi:MAG TPA: permease [Firmicutes bacterium]|jgi:uncharacterized protein|nr:permease [Bacillota bacterium]